MIKPFTRALFVLTLALFVLIIASQAFIFYFNEGISGYRELDGSVPLTEVIHVKPHTVFNIRILNNNNSAINDILPGGINNNSASTNLLPGNIKNLPEPENNSENNSENKPGNIFLMVNGERLSQLIYDNRHYFLVFTAKQDDFIELLREYPETDLILEATLTENDGSIKRISIKLLKGVKLTFVTSV